MSLNKVNLLPENTAENLICVLVDQIKTLDYHIGVAWKNLTSDCYEEDRIDLVKLGERLTTHNDIKEIKDNKEQLNQLLHLQRCYKPLREVIEVYLKYKNTTEEERPDILKELMDLVKDDEKGLRAIYRFFVELKSYQTVPRSSLKGLAFLITIFNESLKDEFGIDSHIRTPAYTTGEVNAPYISRVFDRSVIYEFYEQFKATLKELEDEVVRMLNINIVRQKYSKAFGIYETWEAARNRFHNNPMLVVQELKDKQ
ncbi:MAG: hypothetical protein PHU71_02270 [Candidatus Gracilibacteria bacterium]|nr:hypothetical protein [Candidatus Gracilibacteria bacterium]